MGVMCGRSCRYYGLKPDIKVIAPWREWDLLSRTKLIDYAEANKIPVPASKRGEPPFSMDANLLHISYEGCALGWHILRTHLDPWPWQAGLPPDTMHSDPTEKSSAVTYSPSRIASQRQPPLQRTVMKIRPFHNVRRSRHGLRCGLGHGAAAVSTSLTR